MLAAAIVTRITAARKPETQLVPEAGHEAPMRPADFEKDNQIMSNFGVHLIRSSEFRSRMSQLLQNLYYAQPKVYWDAVHRTITWKELIPDNSQFLYPVVWRI